MSWRIATRHTSTYRYGAPVVASYNEARMTPIASENQDVHSTRITVTPSVATAASVAPIVIVVSMPDRQSTTCAKDAEPPPSPATRARTGGARVERSVVCRNVCNSSA